MTNETDELRHRVAHLESVLRDRDAADAKRLTDEQAKANATAAATDAAARAESAAKERETIRRGAWTSHLLGKFGADEPVDITKLEIPATGWPEGVNESSFNFTGGHVVEDKSSFDFSSTTIGQKMGGRHVNG